MEYSETSLNRPALGTKHMAGLEGWPVLRDFLCKELFSRELKNWLIFKGIGSILFLKNGLKKNCRKNSINHLRRNNYEVYTAVVRCFPNILDVMVLENI
jgi:hypothetical protein